MKRLWLALGFLTGGCLTSNGLQYDAMSETNQYHIARVRKGMSQKQVLQIMHKPYSYETFQVSEDIYDVWFYVTRPTGLDQSRMVPQNLTPLTFKNGVLVGTGYNWYYYAMKEQAGEAALQNPAPQKPKPQSVEDKEFEKSLRAIPEKPAAPVKSQTPEKLPPNVKKEAPVKNQTPEKLPPNVHIISKTETLEEPVSKEKPTENSCQSPCIPCPREDFGPSRFSVLSVGMTETQVFRTLGKPMKHETFGICNDVYDVWFYDTIASKTGKPSIIPQNQTILTFQNAILISMDDEKYFELKKQLEAKKEAPQEVKDISQTKIQPPLNANIPLSVTSIKAVSRLKKGMTEAEVKKALGDAADQETFTIQDDSYDVWFYEVSRQENRKIPLTFRNGILVGKTEQEYRKFKKMEEDEAEQKEVSQTEIQSPLNANIPLAVTSIKAVSNLKKGMTEAEVKRALGDAADQETFTIQDDSYDVWFYEVSRQENRKIPLTFRNGILVGKTEQEYRKFKSKCKDCYDKKGERMEEDEAEQNFNYW